MFPIKIICNTCKTEHIIEVFKSDFDKWKAGQGHIQDLMPYLNSQSRELLISQTCGDCWDKMFEE